ncbi:MAG: Asp-tRNA(Asn)/Glu-tRNA(Gln) amidotransferase subunit GatA [Puniceicoccales bacterium]|jgi:aspartyl-tRNA(Asn)/glutamyl-tRNA(Gln) amidotransferase subunit A|nr:Asp-tRNA(Asn)/Glu-tRNA(Gln) amidotransferase subunit GatA [Puniceicoccales bacterium]
MIYYQTLKDLSSALRINSLLPSDITAAFVGRTKATGKALHSFICYDEADAMGQAKAADLRWKSGKNLSPYDGIPIGIKDMISVRNQPMACGSRMLENYISPYDATVIARLRAAGMIIWGRLNMDEFAMGSSTETSAFGPTQNPWNLSCVPGGSSGGSAAAVAAGQTCVALGTDTGGSIRQPAAFCGIVGLKPTYGRVSRYGVTAFASSLDQVGPLGRSVEDVAAILAIIGGQDSYDSTSVDIPIEDYVHASTVEKPWRVGILSEFMDGDGLDCDVAAAIGRVVQFYESHGCQIRPVSLPNVKAGLAAYYIIATAEAFSNLARFDGIRYGHRSKAATNVADIYSKSRAEGFGEEVKRRIILGAFVLSGGFHDAYYTRAQKVRSLIRSEYMRAFDDVDIILSPTTPTAAFCEHEKCEDPLAMYLNDVYTVTVNMAGLPAISIPCGFDNNHMPIGVQLIGRPFGESDLLAAARFYEKAHDFHRQHPPL